ncbi:MAG: hypothetical protein HY701_13655 [Gemmatimonadetes bacterium]|nr:hypothetical protein [Gemmatimonadota bacterium]
MKEDSRRGAGILALLLTMALPSCTDGGVDVTENGLAPGPEFSHGGPLHFWAQGAGFVNLQPPSPTHRHRFDFVVREIGGPPGLIETNLDYWDFHVPPPAGGSFHIFATGLWATARKQTGIPGQPDRVYLQGFASSVPIAAGPPGAPASRFVCVWIEDGASTGTPDRFYLRDNGGTPPPPPVGPPPPPAAVLEDGYSSGPGTFAPELACPQPLGLNPPPFTPALPAAVGPDQTTLASGTIRVY